MRITTARFFSVMFAALVSPAATVSAANLLIGSWSSSAIDEYTPDGTFVRQFVAPGSGGLSNPNGMTFGPDGNLYVTSYNNGAVKKYDGTTGAYLGDFATGLASPCDIAFGSNGQAYVAENGAWHVSQLSSSGALLQVFSIGSFSRGITVRPNGHVLATNSWGGTGGSTVTDIDPVTGATSTFASGLGEPVGITSGPDGRFYVANFTDAVAFGGTNPETIQVILADGGTSSTFAGPPPGLNGADYLTFDEGSLYVTYYYSGAVAAFDADTGALTGSFAVEGGHVTGITTIPVPEPASLSLVGLGGLLLRRRTSRNPRVSIQ